MRLSECSTWDALIKFTQTAGPYYTYMSIVNVAPLDKEHVDALLKASGQYGRVADAVRMIDPRKE